MNSAFSLFITLSTATTLLQPMPVSHTTTMDDSDVSKIQEYSNTTLQEGKSRLKLSLYTQKGNCMPLSFYYLFWHWMYTPCVQEPMPATVYIMPRQFISQNKSIDGYISSVHTNTDGDVTIDADPGEYSLYIVSDQEPEMVYCNWYSGDGVLCPIELTENTTLNHQIVMNKGYS